MYFLSLGMKQTQSISNRFLCFQTLGGWGIVWDIHNHSSTLKFKHLKRTPIQHLINISSFQKILKFNPTVKSKHLTEDKQQQKTPDIFGAL